ncbi:D-amino-acid oxidase [Favolaschia claudopus]|uniref:D-amino-acid oxidase n=1 Tax=Favolaschia claudopus TaxID=2862362 RepID=A0AAW0E339_9AGAR
MPGNRGVYVVGAGVVGLSTAIRALEAGFEVTIFAELFPGDKKSIKYTSCWAAANHISVASTNELLHQLERETFSALTQLLKDDPLAPVMSQPHQEHVETMRPEIQKQMDHLAQFYSDYRVMQPAELPEGVSYGGEFTTFFIDVPRYLVWLMDRFLILGGKAFRATLPSLSVLLSKDNCPTIAPFPPTSTNPTPSFNPVAILNCTGIGALSLGDVLDTDVFPTRGEVLILRAPWIKHGLTHYYNDGHLSYVLPRQSGDVILGGTFQVGDWHPTSRPETVKSIKERGIEAYPELLPEGKREFRNIQDLEVVEECVGLRPTRKGGIRLEVTTLNAHSRSVPVVHNYGHGGAGYQSSWGSAKMAVELLKSALQ